MNINNHIKAKSPTVKATAPGRINLIGEHIDYNDGYVLPAAIQLSTTFNLWKNGTNSTISVTALDLQETFTFELGSIHQSNQGWEAYIFGIVNILIDRGFTMTGFDGTFSGNIPIGSGMSSSAALQCSFIVALNELFEVQLTKLQMIEICQASEHRFIGVRCGIMDQFASMNGRKDHFILLDCQSNQAQYIPFDLGNYEILLIDSNVSHELADSAYNKRREECEKGLRIIQEIFPQVQSFRDVDDFLLAAAKKEFPNDIYLRCRHVVSETKRVLASVHAIQNHDFQTLGNLIYESHKSLRENFDVSISNVDFLVNATKDLPLISGSRMMGGGFGGCTLNIIDKSFTKEFVDRIQHSYYEAFQINLAPYKVNMSDGAKLIFE